jgi:NitT/TauT family transport system permease protein
VTTTEIDAAVVPAEGEVPRAPKRRRSGPVSRGSLAIAGGRIGIVLAFLLLWELASGRWVQEQLISSPTQIVQRLVELFQAGTIWSDFYTTGYEFFLGYFIGVASGLLAGLLLGALPVLGKLLEPLISALNGIPKIALAPLIILWLGIGVWSKVGIAVMTVFFVMFYNTYIGMRTVPKPLVNALRVMGASRAMIVRKVVVPQMTMAILAGLRAGIPFAAIGVIVGEFVASTEGLGYYIRRSSDSYDAAGIFAGIALLMVLIMIMSALVSIWERRATRWQR